MAALKSERGLPALQGARVGGERGKIMDTAKPLPLIDDMKPEVATQELLRENEKKSHNLKEVASIIFPPIRGNLFEVVLFLTSYPRQAPSSPALGYKRQRLRRSRKAPNKLATMGRCPGL